MIKGFGYLTRGARYVPRFLAVFVWIILEATWPLLSADTANEVYTKACASCHGKDGKAKTPAGKKLGVKDLSQSKLTDEEIIGQILNGKLDAKGVLTMPAFKEKLKREEIDSLVPLVKEFRRQ